MCSWHPITVAPWHFLSSWQWPILSQMFVETGCLFYNCGDGAPEFSYSVGSHNVFGCTVYIYTMFHKFVVWWSVDIGLLSFNRQKKVYSVNLHSQPVLNSVVWMWSALSKIQLTSLIFRSFLKLYSIDNWTLADSLQNVNISSQSKGICKNHFKLGSAISINNHESTAYNHEQRFLHLLLKIQFPACFTCFTASTRLT